jgi:hypothetical protein
LESEVHRNNIESHIHNQEHKIIQNTYKSRFILAPVLSKKATNEEGKKDYNRDYNEFVRKLQMDKYMLGKPKDEKSVNCEIIPYKFIRSDEKGMEKTINRIIKKHQEEIYLKLGRIQKELKNEKILLVREEEKNSCGLNREILL